MKNLFYDEKNNQKKHVKIAIAIDDYKLPKKAEWIARCIDKLPKKQLNKYDFISEDVKPGVTENTSLIFLNYKLKDKK